MPLPPEPTARRSHGPGGDALLGLVVRRLCPSRPPRGRVYSPTKPTGRLSAQMSMNRDEATDSPTDAEILTHARGTGCPASGVRLDTRWELAALRRTLAVSRRAIHATTWRSAVQARTTTIAHVLLVVRRALRVPGGRRRVAEGWLLYATIETTPVMKVVTRTPTRSLSDLAAAIPVVVGRPDLFDLGELNALGDAIALTFAEVG